MPAEFGLTAREQEVLVLLTRSMSNREIAGQLFLSEAIVKVHVRHILRKLGARTRTEAALRAVRTQQLRAAAASRAKDFPASDLQK